MTSTEQEFVDSSLAVLMKAAAIADASEQEIRVLRAEVETLRKQAQPISKKAAFSDESLIKMARVLEDQGLLQEGVDAEKAARLLQDDPDFLPDFVIRLVQPIEPDGRPVKAAGDPIKQVPGGGRIVKLAGKELVDRYGFADLIPGLKS